MKNDIDRDRLYVQSRKRTEGKIFLTFIALIITSQIEKIFRTSKELKDYTKNKIFYELKKLKVTRFASGLNIINELSKKVKTIFKSFVIDYKKIDA
ncbi:MAG TPA: hypothetical protein PKY81_02035 [bacterium]|nr:hypothetical protein [bacterium]HPN29714.1 hypothetical protein [bacterium]